MHAAKPRLRRLPDPRGVRGVRVENPEDFPRKSPRAAPKPVQAACGLAVDARGRVLMARRPPEVLLGGLWELPGGELTAGADAAQALQVHLFERVGLDAEIGEGLATVEHVFSHRKLCLKVFRVVAARGALVPSWYDGCEYMDQAARAAAPRSRLADKVLAAVGHG